jgi:ribosomal protein S18 acetylase RimI-like enzyme
MQPPQLVEPRLDQVLEFCARDPIERVFVEDVARRGYGRFLGVENGSGTLEALCHFGANLVPSGRGCGAFAGPGAGAASKMVIGDERAVGELWDQAASLFPVPRADRPGQPVYAISEPPDEGGTGLRAATLDDLERLIPVCAAAHRLELDVDPMERDDDAFRWRTRAQIVEGRSWVWFGDDDVVLFKAEASAWTPTAVQVQQVWVDPAARRRGYGARGMRDLCRLLLGSARFVTLFARSENAPAIALYESIGMRLVGRYRSLLF